MRISNLKRETGKLMYHFSIGHDIARYEAGWRVLTIGLLKINQLPTEGIRLHPKQYTGFLIAVRFWLPFEKGQI